MLPAAGARVTLTRGGCIPRSAARATCIKRENRAMRRILIADHEPHVRYALSSKVLQAGFGLITAQDGAEAYALACARKPDLIVAEYRLPLIDGLDLCARLRQSPRTREIPIMMIALAEDRPEPGRLGATNVRTVLTKPLVVRDLVLRITELLGPEPLHLLPGIVVR
jgi:CheY-like chemotaxis protein